MQTNAVLIVQKTSKGDVSGNTACTPPGSTCITSTGGKITVRSTVPGLIAPDCLSCPVCLSYHASIFVKLPWCHVSQPLAPYCPVYAYCIHLPVVLLLALFPPKAEHIPRGQT